MAPWQSLGSHFSKQRAKKYFNFISIGYMKVCEAEFRQMFDNIVEQTSREKRLMMIRDFYSEIVESSASITAEWFDMLL